MNRKEILAHMQETVYTDPKLVVRLAWDGFVPGYKNGYAAYDPETGDWSSVSLGQSEWDPNDNRIYLYKIDANIFGNSTYSLCGDILSEEEHAEYLSLGEPDIDEFLKRHESSFSERFFDYLVWLFENEYDIDWNDIEAQLRDLGF